MIDPLVDVAATDMTKTAFWDSGALRFVYIFSRYFGLCDFHCPRVGSHSPTERNPRALACFGNPAYPIECLFELRVHHGQHVYLLGDDFKVIFVFLFLSR